VADFADIDLTCSERRQTVYALLQVEFERRL
jgi:hypothetical protein